MKRTITYKKYILAPFPAIAIYLLVLITSCQPKFYEAPVTPAASAGSLSLSSYVAVGGSIETGYADNTLYNEAQGFAYPNLIANQFKTINSGLSFAQPTIQSTVGYVSATPTNGKYLGKRTLQYPAGGCNTAGIVPTADSSGLSAAEVFAGDKSKLTNLGVPFLTIKQSTKAFSTFTASTSSTNPYIYLNNIVSTGTESVLSLAESRNASFFTLWLGYDQFLSIAKSGIVTVTGFGIDTTGLNTLISGLLATPGAKGAIANVPYVNLFPIITNSNRRLTSATDPGSYPGSRTVNGKVVKRLPNVSLTGFNQVLGQNVFTIDSTKTQNYVITKGDASLAIISTGSDFVVNSGIIDLQLGVGTQDASATRSCTPLYTQRQGLGLSRAIPDNAVLDKDEIAKLKALIDQYNGILKTFVDKYPDRLVLVDLNSFFTRLSDPVIGIPYGTEIIRTNHPALGPDFGGFFSTDRTYPTPKGQACIANEFIRAINIKFSATIPELNPDNYRANTIPQK